MDAHVDREARPVRRRAGRRRSRRRAPSRSATNIAIVRQLEPAARSPARRRRPRRTAPRQRVAEARRSRPRPRRVGVRSASSGTEHLLVDDRLPEDAHADALVEPRRAGRVLDVDAERDPSARRAGGTRRTTPRSSASPIPRRRQAVAHAERRRPSPSRPSASSRRAIAPTTSPSARRDEPERRVEARGRRAVRALELLERLGAVVPLAARTPPRSSRGRRAPRAGGRTARSRRRRAAAAPAPPRRGRPPCGRSGGPARSRAARRAPGRTGRRRASRSGATTRPSCCSRELLARARSSVSRKQLAPTPRPRSSGCDVAVGDQPPVAAVDRSPRSPASRPSSSTTQASRSRSSVVPLRRAGLPRVQSRLAACSAASAACSSASTSSKSASSAARGRSRGRDELVERVGQPLRGRAARGRARLGRRSPSRLIQTVRSPSSVAGTMSWKWLCGDVDVPLAVGRRAARRTAPSAPCAGLYEPTSSATTVDVERDAEPPLARRRSGRGRCSRGSPSRQPAARAAPRARPAPRGTAASRAATRRAHAALALGHAEALVCASRSSVERQHLGVGAVRLRLHLAARARGSARAARRRRSTPEQPLELGADAGVPVDQRAVAVEGRPARHGGAEPSGDATLPVDVLVSGGRRCRRCGRRSRTSC